MLFSAKRDKPDSPTLELNDVKIEFCDNVKYLGVSLITNYVLKIMLIMWYPKQIRECLSSELLIIRGQSL